MSTPLSPNMGLLLPQVGIELGPQWASDITSNFGQVLDSHSHVPGQGLAITPAAININTALPFNNQSATTLFSAQFSAQASVISTPGAVYTVNNELYYNDYAGHNVAITSNGSVNAATGSITGLSSPASGSYSSSTVNFYSNGTIPANISGASVLLGLSNTSSVRLTLSPPSSLTANYTITLPALPFVASVVTMDISGNLSTTPVVSVQAPSGTITAYGGATAPTGYLLCDGSAVSRTTYATLFGVIGTAFGYGDNLSTFNVPDLQGNFLRGVSNGSARDFDAVSRTALSPGGNTGDNVGSYQGDAIRNITGQVDSVQLRTGAYASSGAFSLANIQASSYGGSGANTNLSIQLNASLAVPTGGDNRPKNVYVNYIIKT